MHRLGHDSGAAGQLRSWHHLGAGACIDVSMDPVLSHPTTDMCISRFNSPLLLLRTGAWQDKGAAGEL